MLGNVNEQRSCEFHSLFVMSVASNKMNEFTYCIKYITVALKVSVQQVNYTP